MEMLHHIAAALAVAWAYFCAHLAAPIGTVLAPMLISTLIAGHVNKGSASDGKLVQLLKLFVRLCGWAVHYNEPGSVKLPGGELLMLVSKGAVLVYRVFKPAPAAMLPLVFVCLALSGCATFATKPGENAAQKLQDDIAAAKAIAADVQTECGPMFVSLAPAIAQAMASGGNYVALILTAIDAAPALYSDAKALVCAIKVIAAAAKKMFPAKKAEVERAELELVAMAESGELSMSHVAILDTGYWRYATCWPDGSAPRCPQLMPEAPAVGPEIESR